jgi:hypothetical protein
MVTILEQAARQARVSTSILESVIDNSIFRLKTAGVIVKADDEYLPNELLPIVVQFIAIDARITLLGDELWAPSVANMQQKRQGLINTIELLNKGN